LRKLVEAGPAVFDERGLNAARVDDVVRLAPTSHGAFELPAQCWDQAAEGGKADRLSAIIYAAFHSE
jgi:hypothetical protein